MNSLALLDIAGCMTALATGLGAVPVFLLGERAGGLRPFLWGGRWKGQLQDWYLCRFLGRDSDVDRYLGDVAHDELIGFDGDDPEFNPHEGRAPPTPPGDQDFWVAESEGSGEQALTWDAEFGRWTAVVMNADAARGIDVEADAGVKLDWAIWAGLGIFVVGLLMTAGAVIVILLIGRRESRNGTTG